MPALMAVGANGKSFPKATTEQAEKRLKKDNWPFLWFGRDGQGRPRVKTYLEQIKRGKVPVTYWADEDPGFAPELDATSWGFKESGRSSDGLEELTEIVGEGHKFTTVKPLKLFRKIVQLWCRPDGIVLDPFAGSGTTGHAVLDLNTETDATRRFILIEQGNTEKGDQYAKTLTAGRIGRVITGEWKSGKRDPLPGGFRFVELKKEKIDAAAVNALAREEMIDLLLTSHWDKAERAKSYLRRLPVGEHRYLFAVNPNNEGFFLIWECPSQKSVLDREAYKAIVSEAKAAGLTLRAHVYASFAPYTGNGIEFYKIPDKVLEHMGFNPRSDPFNNEEAADDGA